MLDLVLKDAVAGGSRASIAQALESVRKHLGMEIAYVSEFVDNRSVFREVDAPGLEHMIKVGDSNSLDDVYCSHILAGRIPELMANTADHELAMSMPITKAVPIGAHMSVPIRLSDGSPYGMFCCLSPSPNASLNQRDLQVMRVFADMAASQISRDVDAERLARAKRIRIEKLIEAGDFAVVYQPIYEFQAAQPSGFEALCRFRSEPYRSPDVWFREAAEVGLGERLELAVLARALDSIADLPGDVYLSVNASPETVMSDALIRLLVGRPMHRLVLEVTEHAAVRDYTALKLALTLIRAAGIRLAIDDAGAGYSSLQHIIQLKPDIIKLDMSLTRAVDTDPARRALACALILFARETDCIIVAEGIETQSEMETLRQLGVPRGQGYFLGRPTDLEGARRLVVIPLTRKSA